MLFYSLYCVCFLAILRPLEADVYKNIKLRAQLQGKANIRPINASKTETKEKLRSVTEKPETIFTDVIKNISRVNNVLQELINNYEHLQKIYKSQENVDDSESSSEMENDFVFKNNKKIKRDKDSPKKVTASFLHGTQLIMSEDEETEKRAQKKISLSTDATSSTEGTEETEDQTTKTTKITTTTENVVKPRQSFQSEIIFVDTHKKIQEKMDKKKPRIMPEIVFEEMAGKKTKYNLKKLPGDKGTSNVIEPLRANRNATKSTTKKFSQTQLISMDEDSAEKETFNKVKQPATEEKDKNIKQVEADHQVSLKNQSNSNKTTEIIFLANDVRKGDVTDTSSESETDDSAALTRDVFKTSVLRQAYGDACQKVVIRKCYKACKKALTTSCRSIKCKGGIKSLFDKSSRIGCIENFNTSHGCGNEIVEQPEESDEDEDERRAVFLPVPRQPRLETGLPTFLRGKPTNKNDQINEKELNILRDRYEKACQKISQRKCRKACKFAQNATCVKFQCAKNLKKSFKRNCRVQCKVAYMSKKGGDGSESESESDSESDSESESDSDYDDT